MTDRPLSNAAEAARPGVEVRLPDGSILPRVSEAEAGMLHARGWAFWAGTGGRRHLVLTDAAPLRRLPSGARAGTRRDRADASCRRYAPGQPFGDRHVVEFRPTGG